MSDSFTGDWFGPRDHGQGGPRPGGGLFDAMDQLREMFEQRVGPRMGRGDVRTAVLAVLSERPMHGYQIIYEIEERSGGTWKPSAGSVYPTLQLLADEGLITAEERGGRKTYSLTEAGQETADAAAEEPAPWEASGSRTSFKHSALAKSGADLAGAAAQVARTGTPDQIEKAAAVLDDARRKLYAILADA
jgi:DNA-binding PadR family transcriptional regulator